MKSSIILSRLIDISGVTCFTKSLPTSHLRSWICLMAKITNILWKDTLMWVCMYVYYIITSETIIISVTQMSRRILTDPQPKERFMSKYRCKMFHFKLKLAVKNLEWNVNSKKHILVFYSWNLNFRDAKIFLKIWHRPSTKHRTKKSWILLQTRAVNVKIRPFPSHNFARRNSKQQSFGDN